MGISNLDLEKISKETDCVIDCMNNKENKSTKKYNLEVMEAEILELIRGWATTKINDDNKMLDEIDKFSQYIDSHKRFLYSIISKIVIDSKDEEQDCLICNIDNFINTFQNNDLQSVKTTEKDIEMKLIKLYDHVNLAYLQLKSIQNQERLLVERINQLKDEAFQKLDHTAKSIDQQQSDLVDKQKAIKKSVKKTKEELKTIQNEIYGQLIGIVGIFTAISFMVFGTWNLSELTLTQFTSTSSMLISWSLLILGCLTIIISLLWGISKLIGKRFFDSSCSKVFVGVLYFLILTIFAIGIAIREEQPSRYNKNEPVDLNTNLEAVVDS